MKQFTFMSNRFVFEPIGEMLNGHPQKPLPTMALFSTRP